MNFRMAVRRVGCGLICLGALYAFQRPFRQFPGVEYFTFDLTPDWQEKTEFAFARLMFPPGPLNGYYGRDAEWHTGISLWTQDYPRADRHFSQAVRRLTRVHIRSVEQPVNLEEGDAYDWPWLYAVQVGEWGLTDKQGQLLREYCLRGGFFMADDFHGTQEWSVFQESMQRVFPDRQIVDIPDADAVFHTVYDLDERYQIVGYEHLGEGHKKDGYVARWRGIYDDRHRLLVLASFNSDIGDSWEWADSPDYPERYSALGIRIGINNIVYAMTH